jgi:hypothetical protein
MKKLIRNILATDMSDVRKSVRDALLFAAGLFALTFLGGLDPHSIQANTIESVTAAAWAGADAVYSSWLALLMPMLMRTVRTGEEDARRDAMIPKPPEEVEM